MDYILWHLPYVAGLQLLHAESIYNGNAVEYVNARSSSPAAGMAAKFAEMKARV